MEILQFLLSYILKENNLGALSPILEKLKDGNFDLKNIISNINPQTIFPLISSLMGSFTENKNPSSFSSKEEGLTPLSSFADREIVDCLNCYFSREL